MPEQTSAADFLPQGRSLPALRAAARACEGCDLFEHGTQTVFGEGRPQAPLLIVGEVPGDREDLAGKPFVGPAGKLLDDALAEAGLDRANAYVTNAVKHFSFEERGKRRLHKKPRWRHVKACRPWLLAELAAVRPRLIVCMGAVAGQSLLGQDFRVTRERGRILPIELPEAPGAKIMATLHPSAILRAPDDEERRRLWRDFVGDLRRAAGWLAKQEPMPSKPRPRPRPLAARQ